MASPRPGALGAQLHRQVTSHSMSRSQEPFRFLDLPLELRYVVYEYFDIKTRDHGLRRRSTQDWTNDVPNEEITWLVRKSIPGVATLLLLCRQIAHEANKVVGPKLRALEQEPLRFFWGYRTASILLIDKKISACFYGNVEIAHTIENRDRKEFCIRFATFLAHTRGVSRTSHDKPHVEFIMYTSESGYQGSSTLYGTEVIDTARGVYDIALGTGVSVVFTMWKRLPAIYQDWDEPGIFRYLPSPLLYRLIRAELVEKSRSLQSWPCIKYRFIETTKYWAKIVEELVEDH